MAKQTRPSSEDPAAPPGGLAVAALFAPSNAAGHGEAGRTPTGDALDGVIAAADLRASHQPPATLAAEPTIEELAQEKLRMQREEAPQKRSKVGKKKPAPSGGRDLLTSYMDQLSALPLLKAEEELRYAKDLLDHEVQTWRLLFACPRAVQHVLGLLDAACVALDPATLVEVRALDASYRRASARSHKKALASGAARQERIESLAAAVRTADFDKVLLDKLMNIVRPEVWSRRVLTDNLAYRLTHAELTDIERSRGAALRVRNHFVRANLRLVVSVARNFHHYRIPFIDLIQEGNVGLMKAVHRFDHARGFRFSTYAHWWIRQSIERAIVNKGSQVRLPVHVIEIRRQVARASAKLGHQLGRVASPLEVAEAIGMPLDKVEQASAGIQQEPISLDESLGGQDSRKFLDLVKDPEAAPLDEALIRENTHAKVRELLHLLGPIEKDIIRRRFGLGADADQTLDEIGKIYNLSRERVRQIQAQSLLKMRRMCERRQID